MPRSQLFDVLPRVLRSTGMICITGLALTGCKDDTLSRYWRIGNASHASTGEGRASRFVDPGVITYITSNPVCGESGETDGPISLIGSNEIPAFADSATVILNGWRLRYLQKDHEVEGVGALIRQIERRGNELHWVAQGTLFDRNADDQFEFCYVYTFIAWNADRIRAFAAHEDLLVAPLTEPFYNVAASGINTPIVALASYRKIPGATDEDEIVLLPRGFFHYRVTDHHVLQLSYNIDHPETFVEKGRKYGALPTPTAAVQASRRTLTLPTWETFAILKDDKRARPFAFAGQFTPMWGRDIEVLNPPFSVKPGRTPAFGEGCVGASPPPGTKRQRLQIRDLPYDYAAPLLTGWDLDYVCEDQHVTELGVWIEDVRYDKTPGAISGTLTYTIASVLRDKDSKPSHESSHKVAVLGFYAR